ncbi:hypothetical protein BJY16_003118 [Actinoplanes octamycinicus]|uniref:SseB protein N-terminal domain-containing protein n=1 Tax=Actinoplanes octamycinicus TaxID=135948 RepID=A0A7W7GWM1_9ACTN|nr:SseB family protein [Actinoplanes octamycinicus]MBB4739659.1 hypothetical protein [Actinoplanes octamycinicus]GIE54842.1 hypothetical protein Aoc01nite_02440 [Actinoplanes octamycinicus]
MTGAVWEPAGAVEETLLGAAVADDRQLFFQVLASSDLYLPQLSGASGPQRFVTLHAIGQVFLPVFTSVRGLAARFGHAVDGYTVTNFAELRRKWPDPDWRLAINPGTPIGAYLSVDALVQAALGELQVPTLGELAETAERDELLDAELRQRHADASYPDSPDDPAALRAAVEAGDVYGYLDRLLDANVLIPTARPADPAEILADDEFPWLPGPDATVEVFTSVEALARRHPAGTPPVVEVALAFALAMWPEGHGIAVDPDSEASFRLPADQVLALLAFEGLDGSADGGS